MLQYIFAPSNILEVTICEVSIVMTLGSGRYRMILDVIKSTLHSSNHREESFEISKPNLAMLKFEAFVVTRCILFDG